MAWLSGFQYRKKITISGSTGAGVNYQVLLKVGESSGATGADFHVEGHSALFPSGQNDSGDLRFTASDGTTLLNFWVEKVKGTSPNRVAWCWVKVADDLSVNQDIYCYYGNSNAVSVSDIINTFDPVSFEKTIDIGTSYNIRHSWFNPEKGKKDLLAIGIDTDYPGDYKIWNVDTNSLVSNIATPNNRGRGSTWSNNGLRYAVGGGGSNAEVYIYDENWVKIGTIPNQGSNYYDACPEYSPDGALIVVGYYNGKAKVFNASTLDFVVELVAPTAANEHYFYGKWSPDGNFLALSEWKGAKVLVYKRADWTVLTQINLPFSVFGETGLAWSPDGSKLAVATVGGAVGQGSIKIFRTSDWVEIANIAAPAGARWLNLNFSREGSRLLASSIDIARLYVFETKNWTQLQVIDLAGTSSKGLSASAVSHRVAVPVDTLVKVYLGIRKYVSPEPAFSSAGAEKIQAILGSAILVGTGNLTALGGLLQKGTATLSGTGTLSALGGLILKGSALLSGTGSLSAIGNIYKLGQAVLSGIGNLAAKGVGIFSGKATLSGIGSLSALGRLILKGSALLSGIGSLTAQGIKIVLGQVSILGQGLLSAKGKMIYIGKALLLGIGNLNAIGRLKISYFNKYTKQGDVYFNKYTKQGDTYYNKYL